jgi:hypothetical protein
MSKFIDAIEMHLIRNVLPPVDISYPNLETVDSYAPWGIYSIIVRWKMEAKIPIKNKDRIKETAIEELKNEIYGDARDLLTKLKYAVYMRDEAAIDKAFKDLHAEMYG